MKRERAVSLAEKILESLEAGQHQWPLSLVNEVYVFGSFARGALEPHDLDVDVELGSDEEWVSHFVHCLSYGRDCYAIIRQGLRGRARGTQILCNFLEQADFEMTLLWRRGDSLAVALGRLRAIAADATAGRAVRDSMLPQFEGLEDWISRPCREVLCRALENRAITLERLQLTADVPVQSEIARHHIRRRWKATSPLPRAGLAVVAYWEQRGLDPGHGHLHGRDIEHRDTPRFAGFSWRYFRAIPWCLTQHEGDEWLEVVHPTNTKPLECLRIVPVDRDYLAAARWD
jgi:hypothetical protein